MTDYVEIFTDGACRGNPGIGGWGAVLRCNAHERVLNGAELLATNNRMELTAAIMALEALKRPCSVSLTTDSVYVKKGISEWLSEWKKRDWKTAAKKPVLNVELWQRLENAAKPHKIEWLWVRGHSGHRENEMADKLANQAIDALLLQLQSQG